MGILQREIDAEIRWEFPKSPKCDDKSGRDDNKFRGLRKSFYLNVSYRRISLVCPNKHYSSLETPAFIVYGPTANIYRTVVTRLVAAFFSFPPGLRSHAIQ